MVELTPVHAAVLAVLVLLLLGLAAVNMMVDSQGGSTGHLSKGLVEGPADAASDACQQTDSSADARRLPIP